MGTAPPGLHRLPEQPGQNRQPAGEADGGHNGGQARFMPGRLTTLRILIAEDDPVSRKVLEATLLKWDHEVVVSADGDAAWQELQQPDAPRMLVLDWMMPGHDGTDLCRMLREREDGAKYYILLLTAKSQKDDIVAGLEAGADDYVTKPFHRDELQARVQSGVRILELQRQLSKRIGELEQALAEVKQLKGLLPICAYCKKIRDEGDYWQQVEQYLQSHSEAKMSHAICPDCYEKVQKDMEGFE